MLNQKRFVKVEPESKKSKDRWEGFRPDKSQTGDWAGRTHAEANTNGDNVACLTGWGVYVIDVDVKNGDGLSNWEQKKAQYNLPDTFTVKTPSGGFHFYYSVPVDAGLRNSAFWGEHIDCRADGGYVLCPPSKLSYAQGDGSSLEKSYELVSTVSMAALPANVLYEVQQHRKEVKLKTQSFGFNLDPSDNLIKNGSISNTLISMAGRLVYILPMPTVEAVAVLLRDVYFNHCENPSKDDWTVFVKNIAHEVSKYIDQRRERLAAKKLEQSIGTKTVDLSKLADEYLTKQLVVKRFPTQITVLDQASNGGVKSNDFGLIVARTKVGKTSVLMDLTYHWASQGFNVMFLEMEMSEDDMQHRLMARHTGVTFWDFENHKPFAKQVLATNLQTYKDISKNIDFVIEPVALVEVGQIEEIVSRREYICGRRFDIICIDYAGQLDGEGDKYYEKANTVARVLRAYNLKSDRLLMTAVQSNREKEGVDVFSSVQGGDGMARAATWQLFVEKVFSKELMKEENGEVKKSRGGKDMWKRSDKPVMASVNIKGNIVDGMMFKVDLRGRSIKPVEAEIAFAHSVCAFTEVACSTYAHWIPNSGSRLGDC